MESITDQEFKEHDVKIKEEYMRTRLTKLVRVTVAGNFHDFDNMEKAIFFFEKKVLRFGYASMTFVCKEMMCDFKIGEDVN